MFKNDSPFYKFSQNFFVDRFYVYEKFTETESVVHKKRNLPQHLVVLDSILILTNLQLDQNFL